MSNIFIPKQHQAAHSGPSVAPQGVASAVSLAVNGTPLSGVQTNLDITSDGQYSGIQRTQIITDGTLEEIKQLRDKRSWRGEETYKLCSIPLALAESLHMAGIELDQMTAPEIVQLLKVIGEDRWLTYTGGV